MDTMKYIAMVNIYPQNIDGKFGFMDPSIYKVEFAYLDKIDDIVSECIWEDIELEPVLSGANLKVKYTVVPIDNSDKIIAENTKYIKVDSVVHTDEPSGFIKWKDPDGTIVEVRPPHIFKVDREKSKWYTYEYEKD